ncbi:hypothetical protein ACLOJK_014488 [Asimina triloba]
MTSVVDPTSVNQSMTSVVDPTSVSQSVTSAVGPTSVNQSMTSAVDPTSVSQAPLGCSGASGRICYLSTLVALHSGGACEQHIFFADKVFKFSGSGKMQPAGYFFAIVVPTECDYLLASTWKTEIVSTMVEATKIFPTT